MNNMSTLQQIGYAVEGATITVAVFLNTYWMVLVALMF